ncbi:MAG: DUF1015 family protein, partial [Acidimicrobiia bacterium]
FYVYRMGFVDGTGTERRMLGVVGALGVSDPGNGAVLPHERTMPKPRSDRLNLLRAVAANLDPVWCLTLSGGLSALLEPAGVPAASCVDEDGVRHCLFPVADEAVASRIAAVVASAPAVIADGHHRYETALAYRDEQRATRGGDAGDAEFIMALVVELAEDQLWVQAIHRLLGEGGAGLRDRVAPYASVTAAGNNSPEGVRSLLRTMDQEGCLGLADRDGLWLMTPDAEVLAPDLEQLAGPVRDVDATVADVILAATDTPAPEEYPYDPVEAATAVAKRGAGAAVLLRPPSIAQIAAVAHAGERMPEKTTFFRPKPLTGLVFRALEG